MAYIFWTYTLSINQENPRYRAESLHLQGGIPQSGANGNLHIAEANGFPHKLNKVLWVEWP